jgi:hypothetical protein
MNLSLMTLATLAVEKTYTIPVTAGSVVFSATGVYLMPTYEGGSVESGFRASYQ